MTEQTPGPEPDVAEPAAPPKDPLRRSRTSGAWTATIIAGVLLVLLVVFIAQNTDDVHVSFLGWDGTAPLAVALLIATASGVVITALVGTLRIWQLRRRVRRDRS
ncbi:LapA family protein [Nocardioides sp. YIM 152315]|uniref:LapA family protein n=1 Tax=Nocardioides sp. YIM 152315 TaxID=3031760 RepID=UPI0023DBE01C|nr:LapA family protein [Nocardioides sp. YIM 152315]MDF1605322.1 LapA family protein [Nocardioides sp. YIM 152315]